jgi:hypothetical protein
MVFRPSRERRGPDRFLVLKMTLLTLGGCLAIAGFMLRIDWLITVAMFPLIVGVALNLRRRSGDDAASDDRTDPRDDD